MVRRVARGVALWRTPEAGGRRLLTPLLLTALTLRLLRVALRLRVALLLLRWVTLVLLRIALLLLLRWVTLVLLRVALLLLRLGLLLRVALLSLWGPTALRVVAASPATAALLRHAPIIALPHRGRAMKHATANVRDPSDGMSGAPPSRVSGIGRSPA